MLRMLLRSDVAERLGRIYRASAAPTAKQREEFAAARATRPKLAASLPGARPIASADPENYAVVGSVAQICIEGVLSEEPDFWAWLMGCDGTTYRDIRDAFALAASDPMVKSVVLDVCSPGGYTDGLFDALAAIEAFSKPITVQASLACSAAYALAAMAGPITALGPASEFGSIGVLQVHRFYADEEIVNVTSTAAPNKRPDVRTAEGKAVVVAELDAVHELFADAIARGRSSATGKKYTIEQVNSDFGSGATMLADAARSAGLIDKMPKPVKRGTSAEADQGEPDPVPVPVPAIAAAPTATTDPNPPAAPVVGAAQQPSTPREAGHETRKKKMTEAELRAQHPELFASVVAQGVTQERDRVEAHLIMGDASGDMATAVAAISAGEAMTPKLSAKYQAAGMKRAAVAARQTETDGAGVILAGASRAPASEGGKDLTDTVAAAMMAERGKTAAP